MRIAHFQESTESDSGCVRLPLGALSGNDAAHFIATQRMELPARANRSQELASPQSLPPTPKRRSKRRVSENSNPNAFPGIPEERSASPSKWNASLKTAATHRYLGTKEDLGSLEEEERVRTPEEQIRECVALENSSTAAFDLFSPAEWKKQSLKGSMAAPAPALLQGLRKGPLLPLEEEPCQEAASSRPAANTSQDEEMGRSQKEHTWEATARSNFHTSNQADRALQDQRGNTAAEQPQVPKQSSISLKALAPVKQGNSRTQGAGASRARGAAADGVGTAAEVQPTAREYRPPADKPNPLRTGLEAPTYPCYIEILQKARLRPDKPPGVPQRKRPQAGKDARLGPGGRQTDAAAAPLRTDTVRKGAHLSCPHYTLCPRCTDCLPSMPAIT